MAHQSKPRLRFPIHVFIAGKGSACRNPGRMEAPFKAVKTLSVKRFGGAQHSIHNTDAAKFVDKLVEIHAAATEGKVMREAHDMARPNDRGSGAYHPRDDKRSSVLSPSNWH